MTNDTEIPTGLAKVLASATSTEQYRKASEIPAELDNILASPKSVFETPIVIPETQKAIVAFVDMLGTSALMESITRDNAPKIYGTINGISEKFQTTFSELSDKYEDSVSIMMISDSFVVSIPHEYNAFRYLLTLLAKFQYDCLFSYSEPMRGAVATGDILKVVGENKIIGPAFIRAYKIEMENAIFPRIVIDSDIIEDKELCPQSTTGLPIALDKDGIRYIDFLAIENADVSSIKQKTNTKRTEYAGDNRNLKKLQKWHWLQTFLEQKANACVDCCQQARPVMPFTNQ